MALIVHTKEPFASPAYVLAYLGSYTHRIAISNERILGFDGSTVTFRYRDRPDGDKQKTAAHWVCEILDPGVEAHGAHFFDVARAFAQMGPERFFSR